MAIPNRKKKRYYCTFVKKNDKGELKPNVVVIVADNEIMAKAILCEKYQIPPTYVKGDLVSGYSSEGIKTIRISETNTFEGDTPNDNFYIDSRI